MRKLFFFYFLLRALRLYSSGGREDRRLCSRDRYTKLLLFSYSGSTLLVRQPRYLSLDVVSGVKQTCFGMSNGNLTSLLFLSGLLCSKYRLFSMIFCGCSMVWCCPSSQGPKAASSYPPFLSIKSSPKKEISILCSLLLMQPLILLPINPQSNNPHRHP